VSLVGVNPECGKQWRRGVDGRMKFVRKPMGINSVGTISLAPKIQNSKSEGKKEEGKRRSEKNKWRGRQNFGDWQ
jgi:hypothetical protein